MGGEELDFHSVERSSDVSLNTNAMVQQIPKEQWLSAPQIPFTPAYQRNPAADERYQYKNGKYPAGA